MANYQSCKVVTLIAGEDLRNDYAEVLTINSSGQVVKTNSATDHIVGVLAENPNRDIDTTSSSVPVAIIGSGGITNMKAGAIITAGQLIVPSATSGRVASVDDIGGLAEDQMAVGIALEGASDGDIFSVLAQTIAAPHSV